MKVRLGFVSNSSASSFCIYGAAFENDEVKKMLGIKDDESVEDDDGDYGIVEKLEKKTGLTCGGWGADYDTFYIGRSYDTLKDDETGKQFKESVEKKLKELFGKKVKCEHMEEAWNG
jgi:hypothetical protein